MEGSGSGQQTVKQLEDCSVSNFDNDCDQGYLDCKITIPISWFQSCGCLIPMILVFLRALGTWVFSIVGALVAIPVGIKRKSLAPLVFFGTTGTMLDIIMGISACEREHAERQMKLMEAQILTTDGEAQNLTTDGEGQH